MRDRSNDGEGEGEEFTYKNRFILEIITRSIQLTESRNDFLFDIFTLHLFIFEQSNQRRLTGFANLDKKSRRRRSMSCCCSPINSDTHSVVRMANGLNDRLKEILSNENIRILHVLHKIFDDANEFLQTVDLNLSD